MRKRVLDSLDLVRHSDRTITDRQVLESELVQAREEGVGYDAGEYLDGVVSLAVPVIDERNRMCYAIAVHAPSERKSLSELRQYLPALRRAAGRIAAAECAQQDAPAENG